MNSLLIYGILILLWFLYVLQKKLRQRKIIKTHLQDAVKEAKEILRTHPLFLDTETTGIGDNDEIIEISIIDKNERILIDTLIKPKKKIPKESTNIHNITNSDVKNSPTFFEIINRLNSILNNRVVCVYNADFDCRLLRQSAIKWRENISLPNKTRFFCIMKLFAKYSGEWDNYHNHFKWHKLEDALKICGIHMRGNSHRALFDTIGAKRILFHIADHYVKKNR